MSEYFKVEAKGKTVLITFTRPDCFNAMNREMKLALIKTLKKCGGDKEVQTIILTGEGKAFSSGQDLNDRTVSADAGPVDLGWTLKTEWNPLVNAIADNDKIVLAAINGVTAGAGLSVALSCDLIIAKPKTKFVSGFAQIGLAPDAGSSFLMARHLGYQRSLEFFLTGKPLLSEDLQACGLINEINENPLERTLNMATDLNALAPLSLQQIKKNLRFALERTRDESITRETYTQRLLGASQDYAEGVTAFFEKRKPNFKGR